MQEIFKKIGRYLSFVKCLHIKNVCMFVYKMLQYSFEYSFKYNFEYGFKYSFKYSFLNII